MHKMNEAVQRLLSHNVETTAGKKFEDKEPGPFTFNTKPDLDGLPMEHPAYARRSCKNCYGRGYERVLLGDGYAHGDNGLRIPLKSRTQRACYCVNRGYVRTRIAFGQRLNEHMNALTLPDDYQLTDDDIKQMKTKILDDFYPHLKANG